MSSKFLTHYFWATLYAVYMEWSCIVVCTHYTTQSCDWRQTFHFVYIQRLINSCRMSSPTASRCPVGGNHRGRHAEIFGWAKSLLSPFLPSFRFTFPFSPSSPSLPFPSVPLVVGPVNTVRRSWDSAPSTSSAAEPQQKANLCILA